MAASVFVFASGMNSCKSKGSSEQEDNKLSLNSLVCSNKHKKVNSLYLRENYYLLKLHLPLDLSPGLVENNRKERYEGVKVQFPSSESIVLWFLAELVSLVRNLQINKC